jgi:hypothetical protein
MRCPHCTIEFHEQWTRSAFSYLRTQFRTPFDKLANVVSWHYRTTVCSKCKGGVIQIAPMDIDGKKPFRDWRMVYPIGASRGPIAPEIPSEIADDYIEACNVLPISAKASAALSRRCLQNILHGSGYKVGSGDLGKEIDLLLNEIDTKKAIPLRLRTTIDLIRNFGNFSAHPIDDKTTLQIIDIEPHEAQSCLDILEECFEHFYVGPAAAKARKLALDAKLAAAKKPPSK